MAKKMGGVARGRVKGSFNASGAVEAKAGRATIGKKVSRGGNVSASKVGGTVMGDGKSGRKARSGDTSKPKSQK